MDHTHTHTCGATPLEADKHHGKISISSSEWLHCTLHTFSILLQMRMQPCQPSYKYRGTRIFRADEESKQGTPCPRRKRKMEGHKCYAHAIRMLVMNCGTAILYIGPIFYVPSRMRRHGIIIFCFYYK
jgi:hypothetical protein